MEKGLKKSFLPKIAFEAFKNAEISFNETGSFSNEALETLHTYFEDSFVQATELLDRSRITCYSTPDNFRKIYEVSTSREQYTLFDNVNFCSCDYFKNRVLNAQNSLSCKHVLVVVLAKIMGKIRQEHLTVNVFEDYLNMQFNDMLNQDPEGT